MYYKCELVVGGYSYNVTDNLVNWDDVEMSFKRNDYDGVVRSFSTKFQFSNGAYSLLVSEYLRNYLNSSASVIFYTRNNSWLWNERFRCALDFSTFTDNGATCEINAVDDSLASIIKAKKGTQYEYPVSEIKETEPLNYDRIIMNSEIKWTMPSESEDSSISHEIIMEKANFYYTIPFYILSSEIATKDIVEVFDVTENYYNKAESLYENYFIKNIHGKTINIHLKFKIHFNISDTKGHISFFLDKFSEFANGATTIYSIEKLNHSTLYTIDIDKDIVLNPTESLIMYIHYPYLTVNVPVIANFYDMDIPLTIDFAEKDRSVDIDVVRPSTILNRLLSSMTGSADVVGEIASGVDERLDNTIILPAESIRGLENAKLYTSYTKFSNWMKAEFGFVPVIGGNKVSFVHRDSLFQDKEIKNLGSRSTDFEYSVNSSLIYSRLKVGYDKQDYDSVNGRDEFRFGVEYTTGTTLTDNTMELVSPYRADVYGIEFLAAKRGEDTTDSDSDNDVFMVGASLDGSSQRFVLIRGGKYAISGVISSETMFNVMYAQKYMIEANRKFIGSFSSLLDFASSEGNSNVVIEGMKGTDDIEIPERYFTVGELSVKTSDLDVPEDLTGYIALQKNGRTYKGYIKSSSYNYGKPEAVKYSLIVKNIE